MIFACYLTLISIIELAWITIGYKFNDRNYLANNAYYLDCFPDNQEDRNLIISNVLLIVTSIFLKFNWDNKLEGD